jgi:Asp-tRNA(Asn)/Glu-tRNA(Gln) amidotransferase A subunit family amidase
MARSAKDIQVCFKEIVNLTSLSPLTADPRLVHIPWRDHVAQVGQTRLRIGWHDFDGVVEATPGVKRAVHVAIAALEALGHEVIPYCLPHMDKINALHGPLMTADGWKTTKDLLQHCQRDDLSLGPVLRAWLVPDCLTRIIAPIVRVLYSPVLATFLTNPSKCSQSWQLWEKYNERLDLVKDILADWEINDVDVIIAPGMAMPSLKLGYSAYSFPAKSYTHNYNVLNFPAGSVPVNN